MKLRSFQSIDAIATIIFTMALIIVVSKFNIFATDDGYIHLRWVYYWNQQFLGGQFIPKWFDDAFAGLGSASFVFYPPLFRFFSLPFAIIALPPTQQVKGAVVVCLILNAYGVFKFSRLLFTNSRFINFITVSLGVLNPILMAEIFKRGGFAGLCSLAIVPWIMIALFQFLQSYKLVKIIPFIFAFTVLLLSHIPSFIIIVFAYVFSIILLLVCRKITNFKTLLKLIIPVIVCIIVGGFISFPILFDIHLVNTPFIPTANTISHRLFLKDIWQLRPVLVGANVEGIHKRVFFFNTLALLITCVVTQPWKLQKAPKHTIMLMQIFMLFFGLIMMTGFAFPLYKHISIFTKLQFPFRFHIINSAVVPYLIGYTLETAYHNFVWVRKKIFIIIFSLLLLLINHKNSTFILRTEDALTPVVNRAMSSNTFEKKYDLKKITDNYYELQYKHNNRPIFYENPDLKFLVEDVTDYLPKMVSPKKDWLSITSNDSKDKKFLLPKLYPIIELIKGEGEFSLNAWGYKKRHFEVSATTDIVLNLRTYYYPGWGIKINPTLNNVEEVMTTASDGRIQLTLPKGNYEVEIWYQGTLAERLGSLISFVTVLVLGGLWFSSKDNKNTPSNNTDESSKLLSEF